MKDKAEEELNTLEKEWALAFVRNDAEAIGRYMADDWMVISPDGNVIDKATFVGLIKSGVLTHDAFSELERSTDVLVKQKGQWKSVLTHLTRIAKK